MSRTFCSNPNPKAPVSPRQYLLAGALSALRGESGYVENHLLAQAIFAEDLPIIPLYMRLKVTAARSDLCGYALDATQNSEIWNIEEFERKENCS